MPTQDLESPKQKKTDLFPFYGQVEEGSRTANLSMKGKAKEIADEDYEHFRYMVDYRRNIGWDAKAKRGMKIYNVVQTMTPEDEVSRIFLGYSRMQIDRGIDQITEGEPDFSFEPFGPSDSMKTIVWKHLIKMILSNCEYSMHQDSFFRDYFVMGSGVFEIFIDYPERTLRIPNDSAASGYDHIVVQDYRRPKVGVRAVNPMNCWRNPNIDSPTQVPSCMKRRIVTWNQFAQEFGRCKNEDGTPKYMHLDHIAKGTHVCLYYCQDEIRDIYRIYAESFGNELDGHATFPVFNKMGTLIFDRPLKIHEKIENGIVKRSTGLNLPGICSLRWGTFFGAYDKGYEGDHSVYGMGLPQRIEGEDTAIQTIFNINMDNYRWSQTVALNYKGNNADSYMDVDANRLYGAELIDGEIIPQPLGVARINDTQAMMQMIDEKTIPSTGINHSQLIGDTSKTLGEFALRIRQANRGAEQRLTRLEKEVFKPMGSLLLANALTTLTTKEYEAMTEEQVSRAKASIKEGKKPMNDYQDLNGKEPKRRVVSYIPVKGEKIREDFSQTKSRKLDYNSTDNTLIRDNNMKVETSYIPLTEEYVYPAEYIESGMLPDCIVDSKRMLADIKNQDVKNMQAAINFIVEMYKLGYKNLDLDKVVGEVLEFADIDPKRVLNNTDEGSPVLQKVKDMLEQMQSLSQQPNAQTQQMAPPANAGAALSFPGGSGSPAENAASTAAGVV